LWRTNFPVALFRGAPHIWVMAKPYLLLLSCLLLLGGCGNGDSVRADCERNHPNDKAAADKCWYDYQKTVLGNTDNAK
jgi:hypothetical protein